MVGFRSADKFCKLVYLYRTKNCRGYLQRNYSQSIKNAVTKVAQIIVNYIGIPLIFLILEVFAIFSDNIKNSEKLQVLTHI